MSESMQRRLPIYLVVDCSLSMRGEPIEAVREGVRALAADLSRDGMALETAHLSVITFNSTAQQLCPLTEVLEFQEPFLEATGSTALGQALTILNDRLNHEVRKSGSNQRADWRPLAFLMTDGEPTDDWEDAADRIKARTDCRVIACAAGPNANVETLERITAEVVRLRSLEPGSLKSYFRWVSASIKMTSQQVGKPWSGQLPAWSEEEPREAAEADDLSTRFSLPEDRDAPPTRCGPFPRRSSASTPAAP